MAAFALGDAISKACPPGFVRLDADPDLCKVAATAANRTYVGSVAYSYYPFGCYWHSFTNRVYLNGYTGNIEAETYAQPLCAGKAGKRTQASARSDTHTNTNMQAALDLKHSNRRADTSLRSQTHTTASKCTHAHTTMQTHSLVRHSAIVAHTRWQERRRPRRLRQRSTLRPVPAAYAMSVSV